LLVHALIILVMLALGKAELPKSPGGRLAHPVEITLSPGQELKLDFGSIEPAQGNAVDSSVNIYSAPIVPALVGIDLTQIPVASMTSPSARTTSVNKAIDRELERFVNRGEDRSGDSIDGTALAAAGAAKGSGRLAGLAHYTTTSVFGIPATGTKFVYVFDRSGSMASEQGRPLAAAKQQLSQSLKDLSETNQFQIIFYNERPRILQLGEQAPRMLWGDAEGKRAAMRFIQSIDALGATRHMEALTLALGMQPDVLFFLTDADEPRLTSDQVERIHRMNNGATIHAIEFGMGPQSRQENFLALLAKENGGQHAYVDVTLLRDSNRHRF
jgi:hypothetical protein